MEDPKKQAGAMKDPLHLLPTILLRETAQVFKLGVEKYGAYNWRETEGVKASIYVSAIMRHLTQYLDGEDSDEESGRSHLAHITAGCAILLDAERVGKLIDDRPKTGGFNPVWKPSCEHPQLCKNSSQLMPCQSCIKNADGWTNFENYKATE